MNQSQRPKLRILTIRDFDRSHGVFQASNQTPLSVRGPGKGTCGEVLLCSCGCFFSKEHNFCVKTDRRLIRPVWRYCLFIYNSQINYSTGALLRLYYYNRRNPMIGLRFKKYYTLQWFPDVIWNAFFSLWDHSVSVNMSVFSLVAFRLWTWVHPVY